MYAVLRSGGKQFRVEPGDAIRVERLDGEVGSKIAFEEVLLVAGDESASRIGTPLVEGVRVVGTITEQGRWPKLEIFKMKRRKGYRRHQGHRQAYTEVRVEGIEG